MKAGDHVRLNFPSHAGHGKIVRIERIDPAFNLAPEGAPECLAEVIFVAGDTWPVAIGIGRAHLGEIVTKRLAKRPARRNAELPLFGTAI